MPSSLTQKITVAFGLLSRDAAVRYQSKHRLCAHFAKATGFRIYDAYTTWFNEENYNALWEGSPWMPDDLDARRFTIYSLLNGLKHLPGDTVECGVGIGVTSYIMLKAIEESEKNHHAFDSFEGLSEPTPEDKVHNPEIFRWEKNDISYHEDLVRRNLGTSSKLRLYKGWIPSRFPEIEDRSVSFVHIDVDLYEPTRDAICFFYPRMVSGGIIVCDDYGFSSCPGSKGRWTNLQRL